MRTTGHYVRIAAGDEPFRAFVPAPLPPSPSVTPTARDRKQLDTATRALARLDGMTTLLPDVGHLLYAYVRKEALVSAQIEGTQSSLADLLLYENDRAPGVPVDDVREVSDCVAAMQHGLDRLRAGFPVSSRLLREVHAILLRGGRGRDKSPGEFRRSQVWVGGTRPGNATFVPPPADHLPECMSRLERFLHGDPVATPTLLKAALAHVQFETIHPFLDGNGRLGRLLISLLLCAEGVLREPVLYLSLWFKQHRAEYYDRLQRVRSRGDWEGWIRFFLAGVVDTANEVIDTTQRILRRFDADRRRIARLGRGAASALRLHERLQRQPIRSVRQLAKELDISYQTAASALARLQDLGVVRELTGFARNRLFSYQPYVRLLSEGTDPLS